LVYRRAWPTRHELEMEVFSFIEGFYNPIRRHSGWATSASPLPREDHDTDRGVRLTGVTSRRLAPLVT
jgi:hypothetical protein